MMKQIVIGMVGMGMGMAQSIITCKVDKINTSNPRPSVEAFCPTLQTIPLAGFVLVLRGPMGGASVVADYGQAQKWLDRRLKGRKVRFGSTTEPSAYGGYRFQAWYPQRRWIFKTEWKDLALEIVDAGLAVKDREAGWLDRIRGRRRQPIPDKPVKQKLKRPE